MKKRHTKIDQITWILFFNHHIVVAGVAKTAKSPADIQAVAERTLPHRTSADAILNLFHRRRLVSPVHDINLVAVPELVLLLAGRIALRLRFSTRVILCTVNRLLSSIAFKASNTPLMPSSTGTLTRNIFASKLRISLMLLGRMAQTPLSRA